MAKVSDEVARVAYDLGRHASDEMMKAVVRICGSAGQEASILATIAAFGFTLYRIKATSKQMDTIMPEFSAAVEDTAAIIEKDEGPEFEEFAAEARKRRGL